MLTMVVKNFLLFVPLVATSVTCLDIRSRTGNNLDLPADSEPVKLQFHNIYSPNIYNIYKKSLQSCDCGDNEWYTIHSPHNNLVIDGSDPDLILLQPLKGTPEQLWKFEHAGKAGTYYIINNSTGAALDVGFEKIKVADDRRVAVLKEKDGSLSQKWITSWDNRIRNAAVKLNLDIAYEKYEAGSIIILWSADTPHPNQELRWEQYVK